MDVADQMVTYDQGVELAALLYECKQRVERAQVLCIDLEARVARTPEALLFGQAENNLQQLTDEFRAAREKLETWTLTYYQQGANRPKTLLDGGVQVMERRSLTFDWKAARAWAHEHNMFQTLDAGAFTRYMESQKKEERPIEATEVVTMSVRVMVGKLCRIPSAAGHPDDDDGQ